METSVVIAVISAASSVVAAALSYFFSRKRELEGEWRNQKLVHYKELLGALSDAAIHGINHDKAQERFANAFNTISLVAPQSVIKPLLAFHDEIRDTNPNPSLERHDQLLTELVLNIRRDIGVSPSDEPGAFRFRLIGRPRNKKAI